ncbi:MAG: YfhO family protein, partial [Planctomycetes bacterium]|nr:YfhO family protein [Planctomycetota bacterium]
MTHQPDEFNGEFTPPYPALVALALCLVWIVVLSLPMWSGQFLAGPASDQYATGYAWRHWQAEQWKALGHIPLWNPGIFGGLPYVAGMHGDIFYPTAWLRLVLPTALAMNLGFVVHYVLAGFFTYLFLRKLKVSWVGSVVGALAYQLSGVIGSYVQPGHDGKLFVTTLLPLALLALVLAIRERRFEGYGLLALTVGLALLSPHPQMAQYMLIAAGLFALYLTFGEAAERPLRERVVSLSLALGAVVVGFGIGAIQLWPFFEYIPYSPRAESYRGWEGATSFAIPWNHVPEFFLSGFAGQSGAQTYWGSNGLKLHSEYLGLPVVALAILGAGTGRRRLALWLGGIGLLFILVALGASTPFYKLWYSVVPFVKQTRAPGMALYIVALVVAVFAGFGVERLQRGEGKRHATAWLAAAGAIVLLAVIGAFGGFASFLAQGVEQTYQLPVAQVAANAASSIRWGAIGSGVALGLMGALVLGALTGRVKAPVLCLGLAFIVSADLWNNARQFWGFSEAHKELHGSDEVTEYIAATPRPYRVLSLADAFPGSSLQT